MRSTNYAFRIICNEAFYMSGMDLDDLKNRLHIVFSTGFLVF